MWYEINPKTHGSVAIYSSEKYVQWELVLKLYMSLKNNI